MKKFESMQKRWSMLSTNRSLVDPTATSYVLSNLTLNDTVVGLSNSVYNLA